ncbi:MAG: tetraacyldisaccharide 4'-kinase [Bacteroidetes bacterium]|nr:tetraacyldisaccharide 4'-kinase [Bacteroidota bacterium]
MCWKFSSWWYWKTPHVEYLINILQNDFKIAILSRGYKRKTSGFIQATSTSTAFDIGDEPLQYKTKNPQLEVCVDANRVNGIKKMLELPEPPKVVILDDAFQHRALNCELKIVISEYNNLYLNDCMMPAGYLRESKKGIERADIIIISKTPDKTTAIDIRNVIKDLKPLAHQQLFFTWLKYGELKGFQNPADTIDTLDDLFRYRIVAFTGIGNPKPMITYLKEYASDVIHIQFPDHHSFTIQDIADVRAQLDAIEGGNKIVVTTEKDAMRLRGTDLQDIANTLPLYVLPIEVDFKDKTQEFNDTIINYVRTNKFYHKKYS